MNVGELKNAIAHMDTREFVSSAHASGQHRVFGFITTNIRSVKSFSKYVAELVPEYTKRKNNYAEWEAWFTDADVQRVNKQKFKRLELAKILFRNVKDSPKINDIGEKLYRIYDGYGDKVLNLILSLYVLSGRYFDVNNQPLVEINKILSNYTGSVVEDFSQELLSKEIGRPTLAMLLYNPSEQNAYDTSFELLQNNISPEGVKFLQGLLADQDSILYKRALVAGGITNFKHDLAIILNYYLFRKACEQNAEKPDYETIIADYLDMVFACQLDSFVGIDNKEQIRDVLLDSPNRIILKDIFEFAIGIKFDNSFVRRKERKNIKQAAFEKYAYRCFFDCMSINDRDHLAHELNYFKTKKALNYLEGHHMVQMENAKFFEKDVDIVENIVPVCPNCHRKLHNADTETVMTMLKLYYDKSDKKELIRKGIFVDIDTLARFYGIEGE